MKSDFMIAGLEVDIVAINVIAAETSQSELSSRCTFDLLQDTNAVHAWQLMGGSKDDIFIYRANGRLAPGGYLPAFGKVDTNLSTETGYQNVLKAIKEAAALGPAKTCDENPPTGFQRIGNANQDDRLDLADAVLLLGRLFLGVSEPLPCEGEGIEGKGNIKLHDSSGDGKVNLSDAVYLLNYLFAGGPPIPGAGHCRPLEGCPDRCPG